MNTAPIRCFLLVLVLAWLSGCAATQPARLYVLSAPGNVPVQAMHREHLQNVSIAVTRVRIPEHLDRPAIVTQAGDVELAYSEFHRWGGPLADNLAEVLALDLGTLLPGAIVWNDNTMRPTEAGFRVELQVLRLTGELGKEAMIAARWSVFAHEGKDPLHTAVSRHALALDSGEYRAYVAAMSRLVLNVARDIAAALQSVPPQGS